MNGIMELSEKLQKALIFRIEMTLHGALKPAGSNCDVELWIEIGAAGPNRKFTIRKRPGISTSYEHVS